MAEYGLVEAFDIDDGSLDGLSRQECFSLGVEWYTFLSKLRLGVPFTPLVLENNAGRLVRLAERQGRFVEHSNYFPGWARVTVGGRMRD